MPTNENVVQRRERLHICNKSLLLTIFIMLAVMSFSNAVLADTPGGAGGTGGTGGGSLSGDAGTGGTGGSGDKNFTSGKGSGGSGGAVGTAGIGGNGFSGSTGNNSPSSGLSSKMVGGGGGGGGGGGAGRYISTTDVVNVNYSVIGGTGGSGGTGGIGIYLFGGDGGSGGAGGVGGGGLVINDSNDIIVAAGATLQGGTGGTGGTGGAGGVWTAWKDGHGGAGGDGGAGGIGLIIGGSGQNINVNGANIIGGAGGDGGNTGTGREGLPNGNVGVGGAGISLVGDTAAVLAINSGYITGGTGSTQGAAIEVNGNNKIITISGGTIDGDIVSRTGTTSLYFGTNFGSNSITNYGTAINMVLTGDFITTGDLSLGSGTLDGAYDLSVKNLSTTGSVGSITRLGNLTVSGSVSTNALSSIISSIGGSLTANGMVNIEKLTVGGNASISSGGLISTGVVSIGGSLTAVNQDVNTNYNILNVGEDMVVGTLSSGQTSITGSLCATGDVSTTGLMVGQVSLTGAATLTITGGTANSIGSNLGDSEIAGLVTIGDNLIVSGNKHVDFTGGMDLTGDLNITNSGGFSSGATIINTASGSLTSSTTAGAINLASLRVNENCTITNNSSSTFNTNNIVIAAGKSLVLSGGTMITGTIGVGGENATLTVGRTVLSSGVIDLSGGKLSIDLGDGVTGTVASGERYTRISGSVLVSDAADVVCSYGISSLEYENVFSNGLNNLSVDTVLSSMDKYRIYTLVESGSSGNWGNVLVTTDTDTLYSNIHNNNGSANAEKAALHIISYQNTFDSAGQEYVADITKLSGSRFVHALKQTIGEDATTSTLQSALSGVTASTGAVSNQMTSFRAGNIAAGMTSSFGSVGATACLSNMADADTLADAYETGINSVPDDIVYKELQVWVNGFGSFGEQGSENTMTGYDFSNIGAMVGMDYALGKELRVGGLFGYNYNKTCINSSGGDSKDNALRFGAYTSYNWENFFIDISSTMGIHLIESTRNIWNGTIVKGERTGIDFNINGTVGYTFNLPLDIQFNPSYTLGYTMFYDPAYAETGAAVANVSYNSFTSNSFVQNIGVRFGRLFRTSDNIGFFPEVWSGWELEYLNTGGIRNTTTSSSIGAQVYSVAVNPMSASRNYWGMGVTTLVRDNISVYWRYDHKLWDKGYNVGFSAGIKILF